MVEQMQAVARFKQVVALLPNPLRRALDRFPEGQQAVAEELRLRVGHPMTVLTPEGELIPPGCETVLIRGSDLNLVLEIATQASAHTVLDRVRNGFVTVRGGHRIGICGSGVMRDGVVGNLRQISSLAIRIARAVTGAAEPIWDELLENGCLQSTLLLSPPGWGKTTLLRDLIRLASDGVGGKPMRVGVADERGELAAVYDGQPQLAVGAHTDVMDGCPKGAGLLMLLRGMNPQVLAADEITAPEDCAALSIAANCGVVLLATAHGESFADLCSRALYRSLLEQRIFKRLVTIELRDNTRNYRVTRLEEGPCCVC